MSTYKDLAREIFEVIYELRESPKAFASVIESAFQFYKSDNVLHRPGTIPLQTREGLKAAQELYEELVQIENLPELTYSAGLSTAAVQHCEDTGPLGIVGHIGSRETSLQRRVESFGKWSGNIVEALDYGSFNAREVVFSLLVDDGLITRPHRKALLNPNFSKIGVGTGPHSEFKTVVCILFAVGYTENEDLDINWPSESSLPENPKIDEWLEGAIKLTSEVKEETINGEKVRKIRNHWEMRDGSIKITDKIEKIEIHKIEEKHEEKTKKSKSSSSSSSGKKKKKSSSSDSSSEKHKVEEVLEIDTGTHHGYSEPHHSEHHEVSHHETPHIEHHETPTPHHEKPHIEHHEVHHIEHHEAPHIEHHETPHIVHHETPHIVHHETPHIEHHETPHIEHHEKPHEVHHEEHHTEHHEKPHEEHHENIHSEHKRKSSGSSSDSDKKKKNKKNKKKSSDSSDEDKKSSS